MAISFVATLSHQAYPSAPWRQFGLGGDGLGFMTPRAAKKEPAAAAPLFSTVSKSVQRRKAFIHGPGGVANYSCYECCWLAAQIRDGLHDVEGM